MKRYSKYKPSNIPWIGDIPEHWGILINRRLFTVSSGDFLVENNEVDEGYPVYGGNGFRGYSAKYNNKGKKILIGRVGANCGNIHLVDGKYWVSEHALIVFPKKNFNEEYYKYLLELTDFNSFAIRTAQPLINSDIVLNQHTLFPSLEEQHQISAYLDNKTQIIDKLIANKQKQIELLKEERQAIINSAVTGKTIVAAASGAIGVGIGIGDAVVDGVDVDVVGKVGNVRGGGNVADAAPAIAAAHAAAKAAAEAAAKKVKYKDSGIPWIGEIPEHWGVKKLKYIAAVISGAAFDSSAFSTSGKVKVLKITNIQHDFIDWSEIEYLPDHYGKLYYKFIVHNNDIVFALTRPIISSGIKSAKVGLKNDEIVLLNQRNAVLRTKISTDFNFIYYVTHSSYFLQSFELNIDNTGQQPNISPIAIMNFYLAIPSMLEQTKIVDYLVKETNSIDFTITKIEKEISLLQEYRTALISEVVTGKIDVRENVEVSV